MAKLVLNETNINRLVIPNLSSSLNSLSMAIKIVKNSTIPYDFKYRSYLKSLDENLERDLLSINNIYNNLKEDMVSINKICEKANLDINSIDNISIHLRQTPFK